MFIVEDQTRSTVTRILSDQSIGGSERARRLLPLVYDELRQIAYRRMAGERTGHTLQPTALVHEAYIRLLGPDGAADQQWANRAHFFGAAAEAMRRILVETARRKLSIRHGGGHAHILIDEESLAIEVDEQELLDLNEALDRLETEDAEKAALVKLRYFTGMTIPQAADALGISHATAERWWTYSRARLFQWIRQG